jgi:hypothetical protein
MNYETEKSRVEWLHVLYLRLGRTRDLVGVGTGIWLAWWGERRVVLSFDTVRLKIKWGGGILRVANPTLRISHGTLVDDERYFTSVVENSDRRV